MPLLAWGVCVGGAALLLGGAGLSLFVLTWAHNLGTTHQSSGQRTHARTHTLHPSGGTSSQFVFVWPAAQTGRFLSCRGVGASMPECSPAHMLCSLLVFRPIPPPLSRSLAFAGFVSRPLSASAGCARTHSTRTQHTHAAHTHNTPLPHKQQCRWLVCHVVRGTSSFGDAV